MTESPTSTSAATASAQRKRKWDLDDSGRAAPHSPLSHKQPGADAEESPEDAAVAAAARINAMLAAKGALSKTPDTLRDLTRKEEPRKDLGSAEFELDVEINDLKNRYMLTKGSTQKEIQAETGASITTRGMYYANKEEATERDPPLYLHIAANDQESLDKAEKRVHELIEIAKSGGTYPPRENAVLSPAPLEDGQPSIPSFGRNGSNPNLTPLPDRSQRGSRDERSEPRRDFPRGSLRPGQIDAKVFVGLEADRCFNVRAKLVGPGGAYVKHIQQETGARVQIKGRGSGFIEPDTGREADENLHIHIIHNHEGPLEDAKELCENLAATVREDFEKQQTRFQGPRQGPGPGPGQGQYGQQRQQLPPGGYGPPRTGGYGQGGYSDQYDGGYPGQHQQQGPPPPSSAPPPPAPGYPGSSQATYAPSTQPPPPPPASSQASQPPPPSSSTTATQPTSNSANASAATEWNLESYTAYYAQMYPDHPEYASYYAEQAMAQQTAAAAPGGAATSAQSAQQAQEWAAYYAYYGYPAQTTATTPTTPAPASEAAATAASAPAADSAPAAASPPAESHDGDSRQKYGAVPPPPNL